MRWSSMRSVSSSWVSASFMSGEAPARGRPFAVGARLARNGCAPAGGQGRAGSERPGHRGQPRRQAAGVTARWRRAAGGDAVELDAPAAGVPRHAGLAVTVVPGMAFPVVAGIAVV